ncbi:hypothetical protein MM1S1540310_0689 [Mycobacteroides abscessus subsp. bolletii 1S-154-0310]|uniref:Uncharacterized protein n=1 Tax=Mycobacteroides abscessus MAB_091912_2446 TaxID=1335414 RepID=A0A829MEV3_9MYCO|nr:hypothetical protein MM1S1520914_1338 [Mycobacteroides abscessus subsp. bolletii 1S-152-0914]EIU81752.1 hypothetical protein MM1S1530915_0675 [Mycobacteroides abscessus subsp. bolletii 1S-153-0915]EIU84591.1 hypothetical protein MM1S1540310_0689 [Mycobacteroides abscessus subsp. bolletii 1S-154-0310]ESV62353.1 hypothetical protein L833_4758 [Mycobacteroides abscessus MAB_091912_2446]ETZ80790.1 hypothetical protein L834_0997 [Mycobacteroides abscessus MAB_091912_2455]ETZ84710.1 hypothetical 
MMTALLWEFSPRLILLAACPTGPKPLARLAESWVRPHRRRVPRLLR